MIPYRFEDTGNGVESRKDRYTHEGKRANIDRDYVCGPFRKGRFGVVSGGENQGWEERETLCLSRSLAFLP
jgi:hypothetical protein